MSSPVFAPDIATYATRAPYITPAEFTAAGTGVDVSQLVPAGDSASNAAALVRAVARGSSWADTYCRKILACTVDTDAGRWLVRDGVCTVPVRYTPIIEVTGISTGTDPWSLSPLADLTRVAIEPPKLVRFDPGSYPCQPGGKLHVAVTYVNGWPCTTLAAAASVGNTAVSLASNLGVYPGTELTLDDGAASEQITVASTYQPGTAGPVPLTAALVNAHTAGAACSAMPEEIKQAVILLTAAVIKTRGNEAFVMASLGSEPQQVTATQSGATRDVQLAYELLGPHRRTW